MAPMAELAAVLDKSKYNRISKIRINNYRLAIEMGRFSKTPRNERICLHCKADNVSEIDDEQHLLLRCSRFSEIRIAF